MADLRQRNVNTLLLGGAALSDGVTDDKESPGCIDGPSITGSLALVNAALGAGVLAYPFAFMSAGLIAGSVLTAVLGLACFVTLCIVMHSMAVLHERHGFHAVRSYGELVKLGLGNRASLCLEGLIIVYMFGACVGYLEVLEDVFNGFAFSGNATTTVAPDWAGLTKQKADVLALVAAAVLCFALSTLRDISSLKYSAAAAVLAVLFTVGTLVYQAIVDPCRPGTCVDEDGRPGWQPGEEGVSTKPLSFKGLVKSLPLICFAMQCHIQCAAAYCEMPARIRKSVPGRRKMAVVAMVLILVLYFPAGIAGFVRFGDATQGDILYNFNLKDVAADAARICMGLTALSAFPCQHYPARHIIHKIWLSCCSKRPTRNSSTETLEAIARSSSLGGVASEDAPQKMSVAFALVEALVWTLVVLIVTIGAMLADIKLDKIFQLIGAICGSTVILIMPGFLWAKLGTGSLLNRIVPAILLSGFGVFIMAAGTFVTLQEMLQGTS